MVPKEFVSFQLLGADFLSHTKELLLMHISITIQVTLFTVCVRASPQTKPCLKVLIPPGCRGMYQLPRNSIVVPDGKTLLKWRPFVSYCPSDRAGKTGQGFRPAHSLSCGTRLCHRRVAGTAHHYKPPRSLSGSDIPPCLITKRKIPLPWLFKTL